MLYLRVGENKYIKLEKAINHKYVRREPNGKGGWKYFYADKDNKLSVRMANYNDKSLKIYNNFKEDIFSERHGSIQPTSSISVIKSIAIEKEIVKNTGFETGAAFDKNGKLLIKKKGVYDKVNFIDPEYRIINGSEIFTHNHVMDKSFSDDDLIFALVLGVKEMRIISPLKIYSFKISYKNKSKDLKDLTDSMNVFQRQLAKHKNKTKQSLIEDCLNNIKTEQESFLLEDKLIIEKLLNDNEIIDLFNIEYKEMDHE